MRKIYLPVLFFAAFVSTCTLALAQEQNLSKPKAPSGLSTVYLLDRVAVKSRTASHSILLDVTKAGNRQVAVGERGIIVFSDNAGKSWQQANVPTSVTLTGVRFASPNLGWAIGHGGTVLRTDDGGQNWVRQLDGRTLARLAVEHANSLPEGKDKARQVAHAEQLVSDGPDKPFLSILVQSENAVTVVGAAGLIFRTQDGGRTWTPWMEHVPNPEDLHIYAIGAQGDMIYMAGERGMFWRSKDQGMSFTNVNLGYNGSFFALAVLPSGAVVTGGMKGNAFRSVDQGKTFKAVKVPVGASFSAFTLTAEGTLIACNQAGTIMVSKDNGQSFQALPATGLPPFAALVEADRNVLMTVGYAGAVPVQLNMDVVAPSQGGQQ